MRLTFIANACCIYESEGCRLLADPWLIDGAFYGSWFHYPPLKTRPEHVANVDALYISHLHPDHLDRNTIKIFRKDIPVFIYAGAPYLRDILQSEPLSFQNVIEIEDKKSKSFGPFRLTMYGPFVKHPFHDSELGNLIDSALVIEDKVGQTVLNTNDNTPSLQSAHELRQTHGRFDLAQLNYNCAGPYPSCFQYARWVKIEESERIIRRNIEHMKKIASILSPKRVMPFAGSFIIGGKKADKNEYLGTVTCDEAGKHFENALFLNEGQTFDLETEQVIKGSYAPISVKAQKAYIEDVISKVVQYDYEKEEGTVGDLELTQLMAKARENLYRAQERFNYFPEIDVLVNGYKFSMKRDKPPELDFLAFPPYLACQMDRRLLRRILTRKAHWNNAEIGCHIEFDREPDVYHPDLHLMLSFLHA